MRSRHLFYLTVLFILIAVVYTVRLHGREMNPDETWSVWQTFGTPEQILTWIPYDWTPLYFLTLGAWKELVGIHPVVLRWLSLMLSLLGAAFAYRAGARVARGSARGRDHERTAGLLSMLIYSAIAYTVFLGGYVRPYALAHPLIPLGFWLTMRYFDVSAWSWRRAGVLAFALVIAFYTTLVSPFALVFYGLYTLFAYPIRRVVVRWIPVGVVFAALSLPIVLPRLTLVQTRVNSIGDLPPITQALPDLLGNYAGNAGIVWGVVFVASWVAIGVMVIRRRYEARRMTGRLVALFAWGFASLPVLYALNPVLGFFQPSYAFWSITGMALFGGAALALLPRIGKIGAVVLIVGALVTPLPETLVQNYSRPGVSSFSWLRENVRAGDAVLFDPGFDCLEPYEIDYHTRAYFPEGLNVITVDDIDDVRRVWYATNVNSEDPAVRAQVEANRVAGAFVGPATCLWRAYELPPDAEGIAFENGMRYHGVDLLTANGDPLPRPHVLRENETFTARVWWSVDAAQTNDYSVGVYLHNPDGVALISTDSAPQVIGGEPAETSRWQPGRYYVEERSLTLANPTGTADYPLVLTVYQWWDQVRLNAAGADANRLLKIGEISVMSW